VIDLPAGAAPPTLPTPTTPTTPTTPGEKPSPHNPAQVYIVAAPTPNHAAAPGSIVTYKVKLKNLGKGQAKNATVTLPINAAAADVVDAVFNDKTAWVTLVTSTTLVFKTGPISSNGGEIDATIRLKVKSDASTGATLTDRANLIWADAASGGSVSSNLPILIVGSADDDRPTYTLTSDPASGSVGSHFTFASSVYAPKEPVGVWWNLPDGKVEAGPTFFVEADGSLSVNFDSGELPAGAYSFVFYGHWTEFTAVGPFTIQ
jgi:uncharacterized repeat protein (TIGR01451 family)